MVLATSIPWKIKDLLAILKFGLEIAFLFTGGEMEPFQKKI